jgi:hypothetical protein
VIYSHLRGIFLFKGFGMGINEEKELERINKDLKRIGNLLEAQYYFYLICIFIIIMAIWIYA